MPARPEPVAYVLRRFPKISETFVLNEILALEARGQRIAIFSLMPSRDPRFHADVARLSAPVHYLPDVSEWRKLLRYATRTVRRDPRRALAAWGEACRGGPRGLWRLVQAAYLAERARALHVRHFHAHFATEATQVAALASRLSGVPYSFTAHAVDIYKRSVDLRLLKRQLESSRFAVAVSDCSRDHLRRLGAACAGKVVRVYNGVDLARFSRGSARRPRQPFTVLSVARLVEKKGVHVLVEACRILRDRGVPMRCWIVGKGADRSRLQRQIRDSGLGERVQLLGALNHDETIERYRQADAFALPCLVAADGNRDGLPVSIVEALASGLPVLSTPITGIPEVVRDGENGLLVPCGEADALADALATLVQDADLYARLARNARRSVEALFDREQTAGALHRLLCEGLR